jgi:hypothetical protein
MSIESELGELKGLMHGVREDVSSLKKTVEVLQATQNQQRGGGKVLVGIAALVGSAATMAAEVFLRK